MSDKKIEELAQTLARELTPMKNRDDLKISQDPEFLPNLIENLEQLASGHGSSHQDNHDSSPD